ncbi:transcription initiation factor IIF-like protein [Xylariomycetidae sp. FL0641]|nr:transcription initiation factor IIF-like protein [Xylariomycetidae sp. FL0641]
MRPHVVQRKIKLVTEQHNIPKESPMPEFPMKEWSVKLYILDQEGKAKSLGFLHHVTYNLHPSFENPQQTFTEAPFTCKNEGWGEFEMSIELYYTEKSKMTIYHDLNFQSPTYDAEQTVSFKNPSKDLLGALRETGPVGPDDHDRLQKVKKAVSESRKRKHAWDYEKMGDAMTKLGEEELLQVIQMIHDNKTDDAFIKNDMEHGEFTVDLYTLSDSLLRQVWDFLSEVKAVS